MIRVDKNSVNNILVLEANDNDRTHWLIVATHVITCTEEVFIVELTLQSSRCLQFDITDGEPEDQLNAVVNFIGGDWTFDFYKQPLATQETNLDRNLATLEFERTAKVEGTECPSMAAPSRCPDVVVDDQGNFVSVGAGGTYECGAQACADATYENSDQSFQQNIVSGATFVADDVVHVDSDGSNVPTPANIAFVATLCTGVTPSGIEYQRPIVFTGQNISYSLFDIKANIDSGVYNWPTPANPIYTATIDETVSSSFFDLKQNNSFDNLDRYTDDVGGQIYGAGNGSTADYVVDNYTGIGWVISTIGGMNWASHLTNSDTFTLGVYTDFRVPSTLEYLSIRCNDLTVIATSTRPFDYSPFNIINQSLATSETTASVTTSNLRTSNSGQLISVAKTTTQTAIYCRTHF